MERRYVPTFLQTSSPSTLERVAEGTNKYLQHKIGRFKEPAPHFTNPRRGRQPLQSHPFHLCKSKWAGYKAPNISGTCVIQRWQAHKKEIQRKDASWENVAIASGQKTWTLNRGKHAIEVHGEKTQPNLFQRVNLEAGRERLFNLSPSTTEANLARPPLNSQPCHLRKKTYNRYKRCSGAEIVSSEDSLFQSVGYEKVAPRESSLASQHRDEKIERRQVRRGAQPNPFQKASPTTPEQERPWTHGPEKGQPQKKEKGQRKRSTLATTNDLTV